MRWKMSLLTDGGHRVYSNGQKDNHEQGVGYVVHQAFHISGFSLEITGFFIALLALRLSHENHRLNHKKFPALF